jgi:hypothetical protein
MRKADPGSKSREGEGMSKMMHKWLQKAKSGDKGLTRLLLRHTLVHTRMRYGQLFVDISKTNSGCQFTKISADQGEEEEDVLDEKRRTGRRWRRR